MKRLIAAATLLATSFGAYAAAEVYELEGTHVHPQFSILHMGYSTTTGGFTETTGTVTLDLAKKTGAVDITINANSLQTAVPKLDEHLKKEDFFDVAKYPTITYKSSKLNFEGDKLVSVDGDLTLHGVTKPVQLTVTHFACGEHPFFKKPHCGADAEATIKRSEFGISKYSPTGASEEVKITIQIEATKKK